MKKNLKLFISPLMIILTIALPQAIYGMEDCEQAVKQSLVFRVSRDCDPEDRQQKKRRVEETRENPFELCPEEITFMILERAALGNYLSDGHTGSLILVCRHWRAIMEQDAMKQSIESMKHEYIYQRFLKGVLVYRPDGKSDKGRVDLPIASLVNPLEGTFDLSQCGDLGKYLSISTGYRKGKKEENATKLEIWIAPRFLIERDLSTTAAHFQPIMDNWKQEQAPVGLFWTWGGWPADVHDMDYLTTENTDNLSKIDLYENWEKRVVEDDRSWGMLFPWPMERFLVLFVN